MDKSKYILENKLEIPPVKSGRRKDINNDVELVAEGLKGIQSGQYKSYSEAGRALAPRARQEVWKKIDDRHTSIYVIPNIDIANVARRLAKKISKESNS